MEIKYQNLRVLGPAVLKVKIPDVILKKLNEYIDKTVDDKIKLKHYLDGILVASSLHQDKTIIKNFSQRLEE